MRLEQSDAKGRAGFVRGGDERLMAFMHAVEIADGDGGAFGVRRDGIVRAVTLHVFMKTCFRRANKRAFLDRECLCLACGPRIFIYA
jgi:hypothetical protein